VDVVSLRGHLEVEKVASEPMLVLSSGTSLHLKGGTSGVKLVFFFPLLPWEDIIKVMGQTSFSSKRGGEAEKEGFWPMTKGLDEKFGVVFSFTVVVTDMELIDSVALERVSSDSSVSSTIPLRQSWQRW
jgi:hypothetical protein